MFTSNYLGKSIVTAAIASTLFFASFSSADVEEKIDRSFEVKPGGTLTLESDSGSIKVESWAKKEVRVEILKEASSKDRLKEFKVDMRQSGNDVEIHGDGRGGWGSRVDVHYRVSVPKEYSVNLETGGGSITVGDLKGMVVADTSGGSISVGNIDGDIELDTSGGSISVGDVTGTVKVDTSGGSISIGATGKNVIADTSGGSIRIGPSEGNVTAETSGGSIKVAPAKGNISVDTSGGSISIEGAGGNVEADTSGGSISIANVEGSILADTSGGGIRIKGAKGSVMADTSGGNVDVEVVNEKIKASEKIVLDSAGGSVTIRLPEKIKASINAELKVRGWGKDSNIYSDFPLTTNEEGGLISAKGDINGGGVKIMLNAVNGDINIKK